MFENVVALDSKVHADHRLKRSNSFAFAKNVLGAPLAMSEITKSATNTKNRNWEMPVAAPAMPPKPKTAAIMAIIKNVIAQPSITLSSYCSIMSIIIMRYSCQGDKSLNISSLCFCLLQCSYYYHPQLQAHCIFYTSQKFWMKIKLP